MSSNLNYKQVVNVSRRTWDVEVYEKRAQDRAKNASTNPEEKRKAIDAANEKLRKDGNSPEEFLPATSGAKGPQLSNRAFLKARTKKVTTLDAKIGTVEIVNPEAMATSKSGVTDGAMRNKDLSVTKSGVGWHCKVCDCFLKDSLAYLDHINGRKHQRNLGYSMRVERSTNDEVVSRLEAMVKAKVRCMAVSEVGEQEEENCDEIVNDKDKEFKRQKEERRLERRERKKMKKLKKKGIIECGGSEEIKTSYGKEKFLKEEVREECNDDGLDPNIAVMMGFSGFGGGNKNR